jgi:hypothetical protein
LPPSAHALCKSPVRSASRKTGTRPAVSFRIAHLHRREGGGTGGRCQQERVQKEARCRTGNVVACGPRQWHRRSEGITPNPVDGPEGFAAVYGAMPNSRVACGIVCRKCAERFTCTSGARAVREHVEDVTRCRSASVWSAVAPRGLRCRDTAPTSLADGRRRRKLSELGSF